jgi:alpha-tubulin suppressor-like RCC1 family protein
MTPQHLLESDMRRSILHTILVSLVAATVAGCANDVVPTAPMSSASHDLRPIQKLDPIGIDPNAYAMIVAGMHFTCASRNDGTVYCWGLNDRTQIGFTSSGKCVSNLPCVATPTLISALYAPLKAVQLDAGDAHACILDERGAAWCWGDGDDGQLGYAFGGTGWPGEPLPVVGGLTFTSIGAGGRSTCGTTEKDGMFCWGLFAGRTTVPTQISPYSGYSSVTVGQSHACGLRFAGGDRLVDCWGSNRYGQLAIDPRITTAVFTEPSKFGRAVNDVTTQNTFTCVDQLSGIVQCAGQNDFGQLGNGKFTSTAVGSPQTVGGGQLLHGVTTGYNHACALDEKNQAWCWGDGNYGQLGNGMKGAGVAFNTPQVVLGGGTYRAIAAGMLHTCAIGMDNNIYCWGNNSSGELGIGLSGGPVLTTPVQAVPPRS